MPTKKKYRQELLVWGYMKEMENVYKIQNMPLEINDIVYLYQTLYEEWSKKYTHESLRIDESGLVLTGESSECRTAYGESSISEGTFTWKIKIISARYKGDALYGDGPYIGIIEDDEKHLDKYKEDGNWEYHGYQLSVGNGILWSYIFDDQHEETEDYHCQFENDGDILEMTLDLDVRTLNFKVNGKDFGIAFKHIKQTNYRLAITLDEMEESSFGLL